MPIPDASLIVPLFVPSDVHHGPARAWFESAAREGLALHAPSILLAEVIASLWRVVGNADAVTLARAALEQGRITFYPVTMALVLRAVANAQATRLRGCDSIYVALAQELDDVLVTFDEEQLRRGAAVVRVERPA